MPKGQICAFAVFSACWPVSGTLESLISMGKWVLLCLSASPLYHLPVRTVINVDSEGDTQSLEVASSVPASLSALFHLFLLGNGFFHLPLETLRDSCSGLQSSVLSLVC